MQLTCGLLFPYYALCGSTFFSLEFDSRIINDYLVGFYLKVSPIRLDGQKTSSVFFISSFLGGELVNAF